MARDVDTTLTLPVPQVQPGLPVASSYASGGLNLMARAVNTLYEQYRGSIVQDWDPSGILTTTGQTARYKCKVLGNKGAGASETCEVYLRVRLIQSAAGACVITITQGANTATYTYVGDINPEAWVQATDLTLDDDASTVDITVAITTRTGMTLTSVRGVEIHYKRNLTALAAGEYDSGFVPHEITQFAGEKPLSTRHLAQLTDNLVHLWEHRVGQVATTAFAVSAHNPSGGNDLPPIRAQAAWDGVASVEVWVYLNSVGGGTITVTGPYDSVTDSDGGTLAVGWNKFTLAARPAAAQQGRSYWNADYFITGETSIIGAVSAFYVDASYEYV
jgi:hypothetical protein